MMWRPVAGSSAALALVFTLSGCGGADAPSTAGSSVEAFASADAKAGTSAQFEEVFSGDWDRAVVTCPDVPDTALREKLGINWPDSSKYTPVAQGQQLVVLVKGQSVTRAERSSRQSLDLCGQSGYPKVITPMTSMKISQDVWSDGKKYLLASY